MPIKIDKPAFFTKEYYLQLKAKGLTDNVIAFEILFISLYTLRLWKRDFDLVKKYDIKERPNNVNKQKVVDLHNAGKTLSQISKELNISVSYACNIIKGRW